MTATRVYTVEEKSKPNGYEIILKDVNGNTCHTARGKTRELCIQGLKDYGFDIKE